jgi:uncharacterized protein (DUF2141 family)
MKPVVLTAAAVFALSVGFAASAASAAPLHVKIDGVQARGGNLLIQVQTKAQYMGMMAVAQSMKAVNVSGPVEFDFDVPPGDYAVSVLHDANSNFGYDTGEGGKPLEGVSASGGPTKGRPVFDAAQFKLTGKGERLNLTMHYPN